MSLCCLYVLIEPKSYSIIPGLRIHAPACFEHSFFKVNVPDPEHTQVRAHPVSARRKSSASNVPWGRPVGLSQDPIRGFLTATTLIYAIEVKITAVSGNRLTLQWILIKGFRLCLFQLQDLQKPCIVISCHYLPESGLGNLRACCLPWMW